MTQIKLQLKVGTWFVGFVFNSPLCIKLLLGDAMKTRGGRSWKMAKKIVIVSSSTKAGNTDHAARE